MKQKDLYKIRAEISPGLNYYFDKITSFFIKSKKRPIVNPKKILFLRNDHIGDMVYSTQVFREVKKKFSDTKISVLATKNNREIIEKDPYVDEIFEMDLFWRRGLKGFLDYFKILKKIRKEKFDIGIDLRRSRLNILFFLWIPKIKVRATFYNLNGGKAFLTHPILYDKKVNYAYENIKLVEEIFNLGIKNYLPHVITDKGDELTVKKFLEKNNLKKYVVFAPGATADAKKWPEEKFKELIKKFHKKYPTYKIILSGAESDKNLIMRLCEEKDFCFPLINFNLRLMSIILKKAGAIVANDGCATDIGWISGGKLVALVGPVDLELCKPGGQSKIIHHKVDCYPCFWAKECKKPHKEWCMNLITVEEVMKAVSEFIIK